MKASGRSSARAALPLLLAVWSLGSFVHCSAEGRGAPSGAAGELGESSGARDGVGSVTSEDGEPGGAISSGLGGTSPAEGGATGMVDESWRDVPIANPEASPAARKLLARLYETMGQGILSGMHNEQERPTEFSDRVVEISGRQPAVWGNDFRYGRYVASRQKMVDEAIRQHRQGAVITLMYHQVRPQDDETESGFDSVQGDLSSSEWTQLTTPGTKLHAQWQAKVDQVAGFLRQLEDADVPVLFRPYHEMNGGWFWWGQKKGENGYKSLYRMLFERFTHHHGLDNLVWVFNPNAPNRAELPDEYYPGHAYVDVLGYDYYGTNPYKRSYHDHLFELGGGRPLAIAECEPLPPLAELGAEQPGWTWFMGWRKLFFEGNSEAAIRAAYQHPYVLSRDAP